MEIDYSFRHDDTAINPQGRGKQAGHGTPGRDIKSETSRWDRNNDIKQTKVKDHCRWPVLPASKQHRSFHTTD